MSRGWDEYRRFQSVLLLLMKLCGLFPVKTRYWLLEENRFSRGYLGQVLRYSLVESIAKSVGDNVSIKEGTSLFHIENMSIGNNVSIWPLTNIDAFGGLCIGNDVSIAQGASILTFEHQYDDYEIPIRDQEVSALPAIIEDNVRIGANVTILRRTRTKRIVFMESSLSIRTRSREWTPLFSRSLAANSKDSPCRRSINSSRR